MASFWKPEACGQTVLPDRSVLIGQSLVENAKMEKFKWDILGDFQAICFTRKKNLFCTQAIKSICRKSFSTSGKKNSLQKLHFWLLSGFRKVVQKFCRGAENFFTRCIFQQRESKAQVVVLVLQKLPWLSHLFSTPPLLR